jgi:hypothetical protein
MRHYAAGGEAEPLSDIRQQSAAGELARAVDAAAAIICDEEALDI